jgi:hypothetical protein
MKNLKKYISGVIAGWWLLRQVRRNRQLANEFQAQARLNLLAASKANCVADEFEQQLAAMQRAGEA